jgi:hypothetical protein
VTKENVDVFCQFLCSPIGKRDALEFVGHDGKFCLDVSIDAKWGEAVPENLSHLLREFCRSGLEAFQTVVHLWVEL